MQWGTPRYYAEALAFISARSAKGSGIDHLIAVRLDPRSRVVDSLRPISRQDIMDKVHHGLAVHVIGEFYP